MSVPQGLWCLKTLMYFRPKCLGKQFLVKLLHYKFFHSFPLKNTGKITLSYKWFLVTSPLPMETSDDSQSLTAISTNSGWDTTEEQATLVDIEPKSGQIPPGQEQIITVAFSPVDMIKFVYKFRCKLVEERVNEST